MTDKEAIQEFLEFEPKDLTNSTNCIIEAIKLATEIEIKIECEIAVDEAQNIIDK